MACLRSLGLLSRFGVTSMWFFSLLFLRSRKYTSKLCFCLFNILYYFIVLLVRSTVRSIAQRSKDDQLVVFPIQNLAFLATISSFQATITATPSSHSSVIRTKTLLSWHISGSGILDSVLPFLHKSERDWTTIVCFHVHHLIKPLFELYPPVFIEARGVGFFNPGFGLLHSTNKTTLLFYSFHHAKAIGFVLNQLACILSIHWFGLSFSTCEQCIVRTSRVRYRGIREEFAVFPSHILCIDGKWLFLIYGRRF